MPPRRKPPASFWSRLATNTWAQMLLSAAVAGLVSLLVVVVTTGPSQDRQARLEGAVEFALSTRTMAGLSSDFIAAVNNQADLSDAKAALRREVAEQLASLQGVSDLFGPTVKAAAADYERALSDFSVAISQTNSALEIGGWARGLDGVVNSHERLKGAMLSELGMRRGAAKVSG